ncbi:MazG-like family protein [Sphaerisporangium sp. NPDC005288]|uniref:MazG-like family protein n=1 Tax=Sphaerisporangium sp. NPDC005288 TaxID=3155114 RepID=UPI0033B6FE4B
MLTANRCEAGRPRWSATPERPANGPGAPVLFRLLGQDGARYSRGHGRHIWQNVEQILAGLDGESKQPSDTELLLRILKVSEEAAAVVGAFGQNPRKGFPHTWQDVDAELCDVFLTAMVALRSRNPESSQLLRTHDDGDCPLAGIRLKDLTSTATSGRSANSSG